MSPARESGPREPNGPVEPLCRNIGWFSRYLRSLFSKAGRSRVRRTPRSFRRPERDYAGFVFANSCRHGTTVRRRTSAECSLRGGARVGHACCCFVPDKAVSFLRNIRIQPNRFPCAATNRPPKRPMCGERHALPGSRTLVVTIWTGSLTSESRPLRLRPLPIIEHDLWPTTSSPT